MYIFWKVLRPTLVDWKQHKLVVDGKLVENVPILRTFSILEHKPLKAANDN